MKQTPDRIAAVTGANGFVGRHLCRLLALSGYRVRAVVRDPRTATSAASVACHALTDLARAPEWLRGANVVVHLAALVHQMRSSSAIEDQYDLVNHQFTLRLAQHAAAAGVANFVFLSSVKVNGEGSEGRGYTVSDSPAPADAYARSKWAAECALMRLAAQTELSVDIVRPPLVYGPMVRANFLRLLRWVDRGYPLPFGAVTNTRSLVSVWNLCDLIVTLMERAGRRTATWMVSDGEDLSTPDLIRRIAVSMNRRPRLVAVPVPLLNAIGRTTGFAQALSRLCSSLTVSIAGTREELNWCPPVSVDDGLKRTVAWYLREDSNHVA